MGRERAAAADFLLALADFDRRRGWEQLGHASLFAFLTRELGLSNAAAWYRLTGARLLPRFPAVEAALRKGRLCLTVVGELSRVLTSANAEEVLPRFFGRSSREAKEIVAALLPDPAPPRRDVVRALPAPVPAAPSCPSAPLARVEGAAPCLDAAAAPAPALATGRLEEPSAAPLRAREVVPTHPAQGPGAAVRPLTDDLRRLSVTVSARFLEKLAAARTGLSHALPGATTEQILETALDLLLERQARRKALVKRPRKTRSAPPASTLASTSIPTSTPVVALAPALTGRSHIPAEIEREVRLRDGDRCQFPLDAGGVCGATWQVQLDHVRPLATGGTTTAANLRCACSFHNRYAAELALGPLVAGHRRRRVRGHREAVDPQVEGGGA
ncbi:MAG: HNH endonuclease [Anaeromyxobacter sp.]|nr:HNH endonuclease [Anaeromyxobacter sp.]MBL0274791.1 HNH endonuclease [Anaeromyxobacter sp.]